MKILFDFLAIDQKNGAAEYTRRVFYALLDRIEHAAHTDDITITCLFDSHHLPAYTEMRPDSLRHKYVDFVDIQNGICILLRVCAKCRMESSVGRTDLQVNPCIS